MGIQNNTDNIAKNSSIDPISTGAGKEAEKNGDARGNSADRNAETSMERKSADMEEEKSEQKFSGTAVTAFSGRKSETTGRSIANRSDGRNGSGLNQKKQKKGLSRRSIVCIVFIAIFTLVAVLDVANHLTTASASTPSMDGATFDGTDFDLSDIDNSDFDFSDFQGMMPGAAGSDSSNAGDSALDSSDSDSADSDRSDAADSENRFGGKGSGGGMPGSSDSDFDPSDMDSSDFDSDSMPSGGDSFMGGSDSDMSFPGSLDGSGSDGTGNDVSGSEDADSSDTTETTGSTQHVVANIRSALNTAWIPILVVCVLGDAAAVVWMVSGIRKEQKEAVERERARRERINAVRAKSGQPPLEDADPGEKSSQKKEADGLTASQRKRRRSRRVWRVALALLLIIVIVVAAFPSLYNSQAQTTSLVMVEETLNGTAEIGTIDTALSGSGTLTAEDAVEQTVPSTVTVDEYYVQNGDTVEEGDLIATVNLTSVQLAIQKLQEDLDALDADLAEEAETTYETSFTAIASGRVKVIYAEEDVSVIDTMNEYGTLMLISVDGLMQAEVTASDDTTIGDSVTVTLSNGTEVTGRVANVEDGTAIVTLPDEEAAYGDEVTVTDADGNDMGRDNLSIHSELKVTNYYGTVESISVSVDDEVAAGDELLVLTDVGTTAEYQSLLTQRADLEEQMEELTALMQDNHIYAETTGIVSGIEDDATIVTADTDEDASDSDLDETDSEDSDSDDTDEDGDDGENTASIENNSTVNTVSSSNNSTVNTASASNDNTINTASVENDTATAMAAVSAGSTKTATTLLAATGAATLRSTTAGSASYAYTLSASSATGTDASGTDADEDNSSGNSSDGSTGTGSGSETASGASSGSTSGSSSGSSSSGSSSGSPLSGEFKTVTSGLGSLDSLVSTNTDADSSSDSADSSSSDFSGLAGTSDDFSPVTGSTDGTDSSDASGLSDGMTDADSADGTGSSYSDSDYEALLAALEEAQSGEAGSTTTSEGTTVTYSVSTTAVFSITPTDTMTISISIDELDILSVETGQTAEITLDALTGQSFTGTVTSIDTNGTNSGGSTKYTAEITLERSSQMLTGMNATARITLAETEDILVIPVAAICEEGNKSYVYTTYDEETDTLGGLTEVKTGVSDGTNVEITSGLSEGDTYYYVYTESITYSVETSGNFLTNLFGRIFGN